LQHIGKILYRDNVVSLHGTVPVTLSAHVDPLQSPETIKFEFGIERSIDRSELRRQIRRETAARLTKPRTTKPAKPRLLSMRGQLTLCQSRGKLLRRGCEKPLHNASGKLSAQ
jgi:hypothetical protein